MTNSDEKLLSYKNLSFLCLMDNNSYLLKNTRLNRTITVTKEKLNEILNECRELQVEAIKKVIS